MFDRKKADLKQNPVLATRHLNSELDCLVAARNDGAQSGFTLLELLVVIALLIIVSGVALMAYEGVQDQGRYDTAKFEMVEIRKALLQFRRDSGTNDFPGQGIYACEDPVTGNLNSDLDNIPVNDKDWCKHPANFWMLFKQPGTSFDWNPDTKRGWKGPYLQRIDNVSNEDASILNTGAVDTGLSGTEILDLWTILDPAGSPYFMFDLDNADDTNPARLIGLSQNADYDGDDTSDCTETTDSSGFPVDLILCLLR